MRKYRFQFTRKGESKTQIIKAYDKVEALKDFYGQFTIMGTPEVHSVSVEKKDGSWKELKNESPSLNW